MDAWDHIRRAVADTRSGSAQIAARAAVGFEGLSTRRDVMRAQQRARRAHHVSPRRQPFEPNSRTRRDLGDRKSVV